MEFKVKRDFLPIYITNLCLSLLLGLIFGLSENPIVLAVTIFIVVSVLTLYNTTVIFASCKLTEDALIFQAGIFKYTIKLNQIVKVTKSKNAFASLSLSYDRIRILTIDEKLNQKVYYVSVEDNDNLIELISPAKKVKIEQPKTEEVKLKPAAKKTTTAKKTTKSTTTKKAATKKSTAKKTTTTKKTTTKKAVTKKTN